MQKTIRQKAYIHLYTAFLPPDRPRAAAQLPPLPPPGPLSHYGSSLQQLVLRRIDEEQGPWPSPPGAFLLPPHANCLWSLLPWPGPFPPPRTAADAGRHRPGRRECLRYGADRYAVASAVQGQCRPGPVAPVSRPLASASLRARTATCRLRPAAPSTTLYVYASPTFRCYT